MDPANVTFERFIQSIRESANLTRAEIGDRLRKGEKFVQWIEEGEVSPLLLSPTDVADLLEFFQIKVKDVVQIVDASQQRARIEQDLRSSGTRLSGEAPQELRSEDTDQTAAALEDGLREREDRRQSGLSKETQAFFTSLRNELTRRREVGQLD